jgi:hypothetical protein
MRPTMTAPDDVNRLSGLDLGFRSRYLDYQGLVRQLHSWAETFPQLCRLRSIGRSTEGRELWVLTIGRDPDRARPSAWVDGNMHACELAGSSVALGIAEDLLRLHLGHPPAGLAGPIAERLQRSLVHVLPRMSPDGAEAVLASGRYVRSSPRDERPHHNQARWKSGDVDGDGLSLLMRVQNEAGEFVESREAAGLMVARRIDDPPPYYHLYPEGHIEHFDGHHVPAPFFLSDNATDLNRNFPWSWSPGHEQVGAGNFPLSEPESRAVVEFTSAHPELFAWLNLHTFGGVLIRPLGHGPDSKLDPFDLAVFRQVAAWVQEHTGYPTVSGYEEFLYEPDKPLHGDLSDYAYHQRGCLAYVIELWDLFARLKIARKKPFVDHYTHLSREELVGLAAWDAEYNAGRALRPWKACRHPQLGDVEVGGFDARVGIWNPPYEMLGQVCQQNSAAFLKVVALAPELRLRARVERLGDGLSRVTATVENLGYLPTYVLGSAKKLEFAEPLVIEAVADEAGGRPSAEPLSPADRRQEVGQLEGWGRGLFSSSHGIGYAHSNGNAGQRTVTLVWKGGGRLRLRAGGCRTGWVETLLEL